MYFHTKSNTKWLSTLYANTRIGLLNLILIKLRKTNKDAIVRFIDTLTNNISDYCDGQHPKDLKVIEKAMFIGIVTLRAIDCIIDTEVNIPEIEQKINQLQKSVDLTNELTVLKNLKCFAE